MQMKMKRLIKKLFSPPSLKLNAVVVFEVASLLVVSLAVLFFFSYAKLKDEAMKDAEQTLEGTAQHVDNVLMSVEQSTGNVYWELIRHLDQPDRMAHFCRRLLECNPNIHGCAVAFKPGYYPDRNLFMTYVHHEGHGMKDGQPTDIVVANSFGSKPYTEQDWYTIPMTSVRACWIGPLDEVEDEGESLTFCLPLYPDGKMPAENQEGQAVGVFVVDLSVELLSQIVLSVKSSPNSYNVLLNDSGEYIIHPDKAMLTGHTVYEKADEGASAKLREIADAMMSGKTGHASFTLNGKEYYKFYKPFVRAKKSGRADGDLKWSIGLIYPEEDIFGMFQNLLIHVLTVAVVGLLVFFLLCRIIFRLQLKPLRKITELAHRIAEGHYDDPVSDSKRSDEIGLFQQHFLKMHQMLGSHVKDLRQMRDTLQQRADELSKTHNQILADSRVKTTLLHATTAKMLKPAETIMANVANLCDNYQDISLQEANDEVNTIKEQRDTILALLNQMLDSSEQEEGKEDSHE